MLLLVAALGLGAAVSAGGIPDKAAAAAGKTDDAAHRLSQPQSGRRRAVVGVYGLHGRSAGCARPAQQAFIVQALEDQGFAVDWWDMTVPAPHGQLIDGTPQASWVRDRRAAAACAAHRCLNTSAEAAEADVDALCKRAACNITRREYLTMPKSRLRNVFKQFRFEQYLGDALQGAEHALAVAVIEDVAPLHPITAKDVAAVLAPGRESNTSVVSSCSYDNWGWTNGLYMGAPRVLAKFMSTFAALPDLLPTKHNYEGLLMAHATAVGLERVCFEPKPYFFAKIRNTGKVVIPGGKLYSYYKKNVGWVDPAGDDTLEGWPPAVHTCIKASAERKGGWAPPPN